MKELPTLHTDRLVLRPFRLEDAPVVQKLAGDWAIADTTLNIPHPYKEGMAEVWISRHQHACEQNVELTLAITWNSDGRVLGAISLMGMTLGHQAELGYWIGKSYWGQGICTEAAREVLRYAFEELGLMRVHAGYMARNPASGRVMEKLGMQHEGCRRRHVWKWDKAEDLELYGILKQDWEQQSLS